MSKNRCGRPILIKTRNRTRSLPDHELEAIYDDGTTPDETSTTYTGPVAVTESLSLRALAVRTGWSTGNVAIKTYTMKVATPSLSPTGGSFSSPKNVTVTGTTPGATLHYTTDGSSPSESSPTVVSGNDVALTQTATLMVRGFNGIGWTPSDIQLGTYYLGQGTVSAPTAEPAAGTYTEVQSVSLTSTSADAVIRYTIDGTEPDDELNGVHRTDPESIGR